ncbi:hypothetical protein D3C78_1453630 [compost metagenome]
MHQGDLVVRGRSLQRVAIADDHVGEHQGLLKQSSLGELGATGGGEDAEVVGHDAPSCQIVIPKAVKRRLTDW